MTGFTLSLLMAVSPLAAWDGEGRSPYQQCVSQISARGGDAFVARVVTLPGEDCCPYERAEDDIHWCTPERPFSHPSWDLG